ncbi:MAG: winged helix-turn-helix transcriptional regulator [Flammeovirgaceae bacterium]
MAIKFRCSCAITSALDVVGDKWILVIIKQMLIEGVETFKGFLERDEAIATNILSVKLKLLEKLGLITKSKRLTNKKTNYYHLTDKGLTLTPIVIELAVWSHLNLRELNESIGDYEELEAIKNDKEAYCKRLIEEYKQKISTHAS